MAGLLSGLSSLGLGNLDNIDIFAKEEKKEEEQKQPVEEKKEEPVIQEKDFIFDKSFECPVCDQKFTAKVMKSNKAKSMGMDFDLRPKFEGIDAAKYDVILCPNCGYAALSRYFTNVTPTQGKLIKEAISSSVKLTVTKDYTYSYEEAYERYKLCLANAVVKKAKTSEKAFICLKFAWLLRGYAESLIKEGPSMIKRSQELKAEEDTYLQNALGGFTEARVQEKFPICGMDEFTLDYLLAQINFHFRKYEDALKLIGGILIASNAPAKIKNLSRDLKEQVFEEINALRKIRAEQEEEKEKGKG